MRRLIRLLLSAGYYGWLRLQSAALKACGRSVSGTCVVLYYHVVNPVEREKFAQQMETLVRIAHPISLANPPKLELGTHYAAVTFDDGFRKTIEVVLPELKKRKIPVTVFIPTAYLGSEPQWIRKRRSPHYGGKILSGDEIKKLAEEAFVSFGSHCVTHRPLPALSEADAREEIFRSKADLEAITGKDVTSLSFPHGAFRHSHVEMAKMAGYTRAFSITPSMSCLRQDEFVNGRVRVDPHDSLTEFWLKVAGAYSWQALRFQVGRRLT